MRIVLLLSATLLTGCPFLDEGGKLCVGEDCQYGGNDGDGGGGGVPTQPPPPLELVFEEATVGSPRVALGGVFAFRAEARPAQIPHVSLVGSAATLAITSEATRLTTAELTAVEIGEVQIEASVPTNSYVARLSVGVAELESIVVATSVVLQDVNELELELRAADGVRLIDHSLAIDASSDPGFKQWRWDIVSIPNTPGDHILALARRTGDVHHVPVRVVDHVDAIAFGEIRHDTWEVGSGSVCASATVDDELVFSRAWAFSGTGVHVAPFTTEPHCVRFEAAQPGATVTATLAGTSTPLVVRPLM